MDLESAILEWSSERDYHVKIKRLGISDTVFEQGEQIELQKESGFCPKSIFQAVRDSLFVTTVKVESIKLFNIFVIFSLIYLC